MPHFFQRTIPLLLALFMATSATGCSSSGEEVGRHIPMDQYLDQIQRDPFSIFFDLEDLSQETLAQVMQTVDRESTRSNVLFRVTQTMGDDRFLYIAYQLTFPQPTDTNSMEVLAQGLFQATLNEGTITDPSLPITGPQYHSCGGHTNQIDDRAVVGYLTFQTNGEPLAGKSLTLVISDEYFYDSTHVISWTAKNAAPTRQAALTNENGDPVGTAVLSPLSLSISLQDHIQEDLDDLANSVRLLPEDFSDNIASRSADLIHGLIAIDFYAPVEPGGVTTIQAGPFTGTFQ